MTKQRTVLVLGASGRLGAACVQAFAAAGWRVLAQQRRAPQAPLPRGAEFVGTPLHDTAGLAALAAGASVVVYAVNPPYTRWDAELLPLFDHGLDLAARLGTRLLVPGNVYNYGPPMPPVLDEATPQLPGTRKGVLRVAMEDAMRQRAAQGLDSVLIRAGDFFGSGTGSWLDQAVVKHMGKGKLVYPGPLHLLHLPHAWAYLPDLAKAFVAVAERPAMRGHQALHFAGHTLTGHAFLAALQEAAGALGLAPAAGWRVGSLPWSVIRAVGLLHPLWRELARMRHLWHQAHALDGTALARAVGPLPATPAVAALRAALLDLGLGQASVDAAAALRATTT